MRHPVRGTALLPVAIIVLGVLIPLLLGGGRDAPRSTGEMEEPTFRGRTADEWSALAEEALERGAYALALGFIKTAEKVERGTQYADRLAVIRRARWRANEIERERKRLLSSDVARVEFDEAGGVTHACRTAVVLPGESLWSLARSLVAAERGVLPTELAASGSHVHDRWDLLTDLNGVRELEVGELVAVPLAGAELEGLAESYRADLDRLERAAGALAAGDVAEAEAMRVAIEGEFVLGSERLLSFDDDLARAVEAERARELAAREEALVTEAYDLFAAAGELPRATRYGELVESLDRTRALLAEAEGLTEGEQYAQAALLVDAMIVEARRVRVREDGTVVAEKPAGVEYTEAARSAVEWLLGRALATSGKAFPHHDQKTADEIAWARYLVDASEMARRSGDDFAVLLLSSDEDLELRLPNPDAYFGE